MNSASTHSRKYELKARAERQRQTRDRIVAATVALHTEVGPARTTISDIARRAGVQRLTVYNTFPDSADLFAACQSHFMAHSPPPVPAASARRDALRAFEDFLRRRYAWYRANRAMQEKVHRDRHLIPELDALMARTTDARLDAVASDQVAALNPRPARARSLRAIVRLALSYPTWELFADQGLTDTAIARLMREAVSGVREARASNPIRAARVAGRPRATPPSRRNRPTE